MSKPPKRHSEPLAVIELGSTSVRMMIAQVSRRGQIHVIDQLQQAIALGRDTFTNGTIDPDTTEACVKAVKSFIRVIQEYGISLEHQTKAIASSAVREAANRETFIDRIWIATGIKVSVIEEAELNRLTYRAARPILLKQTSFKKGDTLVVEVGGGSTETLRFHGGKVTGSHMYKLGSLRLSRSLDEVAASRQRTWDIMTNTIEQTLEQICSGLKPSRSSLLMAMGSDMRFAAAQLIPEWDRHSLVKVPVDALTTLTETIKPMSLEAIVNRYHLSYEDAETIRPALLIYSRLAHHMKVKHILVADVNLRSGLLREMSTGGMWTAEFKNQIVNSSLEIANQYHVNLRHARHVAAYALDIFHYLQKEHSFTTREEMILHVAALLHEVGGYVNDRAHHKHSYYLIGNSDIFGLGTKDVNLAALVARYHRRSAPKSSHNAYMQLPRIERISTCKMAAILRIANALDCLKDKHQLSLQFNIEERTLIIITDVVTNLPLIQRQVSDRADLFKQVYGLNVVIRQTLKGY